MGDCIYCGKAVGFLRKTHKECKQNYENGKDKIIFIVAKSFSRDVDLGHLEKQIEQIAKDSLIDPNCTKSLVATGWVRAVDLAFEDGIITEQEEDQLCKLSNHFNISKETLDQNGSWTRVVKGAVIRDVLDGKLPERMNININLPFNLQKTEKIIWVFRGVSYYEQKTRSNYVGRSSGMSVRVSKGLYLRTGGFSGRKVQTSETFHADTGLFGITNKHIYFAGPSKQFRIAYSKIVAFDQFSDGIGVQRDATAATPQIFQTGDGWFTCNLITNLAQM